MPETRHMITVEILNNDSPVGFPRERYRFFLSDEGYKNARASESRGEVKIRSHAAVSATTGEETRAFLLALSRLPGSRSSRKASGGRWIP